MQPSSPNLLVVDDDPVLLDLLTDMLAPISAAVHAAGKISDALQVLRDHLVDVIVVDVASPAELDTVLAYTAERENTPAVVIVSGNPTLSDALGSAHLLASDFLLKPAKATRLRKSVLRAFAEVEERRSRDKVAKVSESERLQLQILIGTLDACEHDTCLHSLRVLEYCYHLAELVDYPESQFPELARAALLHDIGKIGIPSSILCKPGRLTPEEFEIMSSHVLKGVRILERVSIMRASIPIVLHHHEHYDGTGYPNGARGEDIPFGARIFSVVDALDAITSDRPYRRALSFEAARDEVRRCASHQFDPDVADAFLRVTPKTWRKLRACAGNTLLSNDNYLERLLRRDPPVSDLRCSTYDGSQQTFV